MRKVNIVAMATMVLAAITVVTDLVRASANIDPGKTTAVQVQTTGSPAATHSDPT